MAALKAKCKVEFVGCGGDLMAREGLNSLFPIAPFSVIGPIGALRAAPAAFRGATLLAKAAQEMTVDAAILIDSWAFSKIAAEKIAKTAPSVKRIKYVAPQVWASRPRRARRLEALFDGLLTLFEFEAEYFDQSAVKVRFVGNSTFQKAANAQPQIDDFRLRHNLQDRPLLAILPGSRRGEIRRIGPVFGRVAGALLRESPDLAIGVAVAPAVANDVAALVEDWPRRPIMIGAEDRYALFAASRAALAASGTVTTELAISGAPTVVGYRVDPVSAFWARRVITSDFVSLMNIAARREIIPEFLQEACDEERLAAALRPLLFDERARAAQLDAFKAPLKSLGVGAPPAAEAAANAILEWIGAN